MGLQDISCDFLIRTVWSGLVGCALYTVYLCIYRLYFHPLSSVPGPKLAAVTRFYEAYYNVLWHDGQYLFKTERLHAIYGPIVRISPNEVSIKDPHFYDKIYYIGSGFEKDPAFYSGFGVNHSMFATRSNAQHSAMRASFNPFFSRRNILSLEYAVKETVGKLCGRIDKAVQDKNPFDILHGFKAVSIDVITGFAFDFSFNLLDREDVGKSFCEETEARLGSHWIAMYFPVIHIILPRLPLGLVKVLQPGIQALIDLKGTVGGALTSTVFGILSNPAIGERLHKELKEAFPDPNEELSFLKLETIPYLSAVIKEGTRKYPGLIARLPRLTPPGGISYGQYYIPEGVSISMSAYYMHKDEVVFPEPAKFNPERWIGPDARSLEKFLVPFSKGSRACLGINLAYCELFLIVGSIFRKYDLEIYDTSEADITPVRDYMIGYPMKESKGFRVLARDRAH
ncbi:hypothetical protein Q9L58_008259 [Maublancomyces gigas]|uniref:Cytochrome P450 n=1 Tax=Discina gigas TaxID=1032678 RepID=A0ABR3GB86_9PEZI